MVTVDIVAMVVAFTANCGKNKVLTGDGAVEVTTALQNLDRVEILQDISGTTEILKLLFSCNARNASTMGQEHAKADFPKIAIEVHKVPKRIAIPKNIVVGEYFEYIDSLVQRYDPIVP